MKLSFVVPCFNEQGNVGNFYKRVEEVFRNSKYSYEYIFVNDGSKDQTYEKLKLLVNIYTNANIKVINFSRNFGKESAMYAGLQASKGEYVVIIDADLQQDPAYVVNMMKAIEEEPSYDSVAAFQENRHEGKILKTFKSWFYHLINRISEVEFVDGASDFRLLRRNMVDAILALPERNRFSKGIFSWVGFKTLYMPYEVHDRVNGQSSWSFWKLFRYAVEGFVSFSMTPLRIATFFGLVFSLLAFLYLVFVVIQTICFGIQIAGYATIICLILLIGGIQLFCLGIIGEYLARNYIEAKQRPIYVVKDIISTRED